MLEEAIPYLQQRRRNFWIVIAIYFSIFINSYVFFKEPFEFYIGYLIYILLLPGFIRKFGFHKNMVYVFIILFITGFVNVLLDNNTSAQFFKIFVGLFLSYFFYYYVILELDFNIDQLFKWYLKGCYVVALLGLFQFVCFQLSFEPGYLFFGLFNKWGIAPGGLFGLRINSVFSEPTHLGATLSAAFFVSVYNLFQKQSYGLSRFQSAIIIAVYLLSFSGLGQLGIFLTFILLGISFGIVRYLIILIPVMIVSFNFLYNNVTEFKERLDSTFGLFFGGETFQLGKTHGSSFILYNNYIVATENFKTNFLFGSGVGSHPTAFAKYSIAKDIKTFGFNTNGADANSMLLRLISETGIFGVSIFLIIIVIGYVKRNRNHLTYHWLVSNSILVMILLNLFRQGHYFLNGFPFFLLLYYFNSVSYKNYLDEANLELEN